MFRPRFLLAGALLLCAVTLTYSNHFRNAFHFDDFHSITDNVFVRDLDNLPRFFTDATTASALPANRAWRPLVTASLALDYRLGKGYDPFSFHLSTFLWFLTQLVLMFWLYTAILAKTGPGSEEESARNFWIAWLAAAWYGLHPATAETVNYIIQRAEVMSTCGVVGGLVAYALFPNLRRYGLYLVPVALALLAKTPALVFPLLLMAYLLLFEEGPSVRGLKAAVRKSIPALALSAAFAVLQAAMLPTSFAPGAISGYRYVITQPYVAFRYFTSCFLPTHLSADTDLAALETVFTLEALGGSFFLVALLYVVCLTARRTETRPVAFGLIWFLLALIPTSVFPLAEVENDHRTYFPFVGLVLAVTWSGALALEGRPLDHRSRAVFAAALACLLLFCAVGTRRRNEVWRTEETLWADVTVKSPRNGRGLMNYGLTQMSQGNYQLALTYFERAAQYTPNYASLEVNLAIAKGGLNRDAEAVRHFQRAMQLAPDQATPYFFYGRWLSDKGRTAEAVEILKTAVANNPVAMDARHQLLRAYQEQRQWDALKALAEDSLKLAPNDPTVERYLDAEGEPLRTVERTGGGTREGEAAELLLGLSLRYYQAADYANCIQAANAALAARPDYAEAYNNIAAANAAMGRWDEAIRAAKDALRLRPDFPLARNNLAWAESEKSLQAAKKR